MDITKGIDHIIIDGNNLLYRVICGVDKREEDKEYVISVDGININYISTFLDDLYNYISKFLKSKSNIYIVWDRKLDLYSKNWRNDIIPSYKCGKDNSELKKKVYDTCFRIKKVTELFGVKNIFPLTSECDDIINYLCNTLEGGKLIVSSDQDFLQCVNEETYVYSLSKKTIIDEFNFIDEVGVSIENFVLYKSIKGDTSDNIKGLYRYGEVKAKKLAENWETEKEKLSDEQLMVIEECKSVIDLNFKSLGKKEIRAVELQLSDVIDLNADDVSEMARELSIYYRVPEWIYTKWENYLENKKLANLNE